MSISCGNGFCAPNGGDVMMKVIAPFSFGVDGDDRKLQLAKCKG
jgi:hypothetical protein